ncbi:hypothetical protein [Azospirillum lipoferum]|uniref:Uncharacterized protein n=1 Tax=Azospirillum lipoferum TaxID=193 RepID=A0A5A9GGZ3_AZOLI|nr:hypothetical protein FZ942_24665 [Azospirillum lipoferum]
MTMSFVDMFACALGALLFVMLTMFERGDQEELILHYPLRIVTANLPPIHLGQPVSFPLAAQGGTGSYRWTLVDDPRDRTKCAEGKPRTGLPPGLALRADGHLEGTPQLRLDAGGGRLEMPLHYCFDVEVESLDGTETLTESGAGIGVAAPDAPPPRNRIHVRQTLALKLWPPLTVAAPTVQGKRLPTAYVGERFEYQFGDIAPVKGRRWEAKGALLAQATGTFSDVPDLDMDKENGQLSWWPRYRGVLHLTVFVTDHQGLSQAQFEVQVQDRPVPYAAPTVITERLPDIVAGLDYEVALSAASGEAPLIWHMDGKLPPGIVFNGVTGVLRGNVSPKVLGKVDKEDYRVTIAVQDRRSGRTDGRSISFSLISAGRPDRETVKITTKPESIADTPFIIGEGLRDIVFSAVGGRGKIGWTVEFTGDSLGLTSVDNRILPQDDPRLLRPGTTNVRVTARSEDEDEDTQYFTIRVVPPEVRLVSSTSGDFGTGGALRLSVAAYGGNPPYAYDVRIPQSIDWLKEVRNGGILTLEGSPTAPAAFDIEVQARDSQGHPSAPTRIPLLVPEPLEIKSPDTFVQRAGTAFREKLFATGGIGTLRWDLAHRSAASWLTINSEGELEGLPEAPGEHVLTVFVSDDTNRVDSKEVKVMILPETLARGTAGVLRELKTWRDIEAYFSGYAQCHESGQFCVLPSGAVHKQYTLGQMPGFAEVVGGALPDGLKKAPPDDSLAYWNIGGEPKKAGTFTFRVRLRDRDGNIMIDEVALKVTIRSPREYMGRAFWYWISHLW